MKVGDLVEATFPLSLGNSRGIGIILDHYENEDGMLYFEVQWNNERMWLTKEELRLFSEAR